MSFGGLSRYNGSTVNARISSSWAKNTAICSKPFAVTTCYQARQTRSHRPHLRQSIPQQQRQLPGLGQDLFQLVKHRAGQRRDEKLLDEQKRKVLLDDRDFQDAARTVSLLDRNDCSVSQTHHVRRIGAPTSDGETCERSQRNVHISTEGRNSKNSVDASVGRKPCNQALADGDNSNTGSKKGKVSDSVSRFVIDCTNATGMV